MCQFILICHPVNHNGLPAALEELQQPLQQGQGPPSAGGGQLRKHVLHTLFNSQCGHKMW